MNKSISITMGIFENEYILEEKSSGNIIVKAPYIAKDDEDQDVVEHNIIEIEKGFKADVVRQFFQEESTLIIRDGIAYNIDSILFDMVPLPSHVEADNITD